VATNVSPTPGRRRTRRARSTAASAAGDEAGVAPDRVRAGPVGGHPRRWCVAGAKVSFAVKARARIPRWCPWEQGPGRPCGRSPIGFGRRVLAVLAEISPSVEAPTLPRGAQWPPCCANSPASSTRAGSMTGTSLSSPSARRRHWCRAGRRLHKRGRAGDPSAGGPPSPAAASSHLSWQQRKRPGCMRCVRSWVRGDIGGWGDAGVSDIGLGCAASGADRRHGLSGVRLSTTAAFVSRIAFTGRGHGRCQQK